MKQLGTLLIVSLLPVALLQAGRQTRARAVPEPLNVLESYPYGSDAFTRFVTDSYGDAKRAQGFYAWFASRYRQGQVHFADNPRLGIENYLTYKKNELAQASGPALAAKQRSFAAATFMVVKRVIPRFSLDHGFEFQDAQARGMRQCFLQSVLIAGILQRAGMNAGVAMVNRNEQGQEINNKHAVCLARLADGRDLIVDASDDLPFARHRGLYVASTDGGYRFVSPVFDKDAGIGSYRAYKTPQELSVASIRPLDVRFVRSQFEYYRGERTAGGIMAKTRTPAGLALAERHLERSIQWCPQNSLARYMLGRVYALEGRKAKARQVLAVSQKLYRANGWVPPDQRELMAELDATAVQ